MWAWIYAVVGLMVTLLDAWRRVRELWGWAF
jgi:hypothetical protein